MSDVTAVFDYDKDDDDQTDSIAVSRDSKRGLYVHCANYPSSMDGYASCDLPDSEVIRLAIALIQATPDEPSAKFQPYQYGNPEMVGATVRSEYTESGRLVHCSHTREDAISLALALIRAAVRERQ